jgi:predicted ABC-type ATPase
MHRVRIFAGPNGSGKSTLFKQLQEAENSINLDHYLNPDELHKLVNNSLLLDLENYDVSAKQSDWITFWNSHGLRSKAPLLAESHIENNILVFKEKPKSYESSILSDFLRHQLLKTGQTFSFETVFSHPSKLDFMTLANDEGYRCYLYFAAVSSPEISVKRVQQRKEEGGHGVPENKIRKRYTLTLENLVPAMRLAYRAYLFDNSKEDMKLVTEMTPNGDLELKGNIPPWVEKYVLSKL